MEIEIRLKKLLQDRGLYHHGVEQEIARACGLHRHTIGKLLRNQASNPSLEVLGQVCEWLAAKGVPRSILPRALVGAQKSELWRAIGGPHHTVHLYLGEYREFGLPGTQRRWVARRDAALAADIAHHLALRSDSERAVVDVQTHFVPFRYTRRASRARTARLEEDTRNAQRIYQETHTPPVRHNSLYLGSQRVNYLTEYFVSDIFRCPKPFSAPESKPRVPFWLQYRSPDLAVTSVCGGMKPPRGFRGKSEPGTYFVDEGGQWRLCRYIEDRQDAGIVIIASDPGTEVVEIALFGFSGRSTEALGDYLISHSAHFWPLRVEAHGRKVGVFICQFTFAKDPASTDEHAVNVTKAEIVGLHDDVLRDYLHGG
jgi:transcriptional regulator with XRE-family HTH domain